MAGKDNRKDPHVNPEGAGPTLVIKLPAWIHWIALVLAVALWAIWCQWGQDALKNVLGILAAVAAFYSWFYARTAIRSVRERERRFETIKYSGIFSDSSHIGARFTILNRYRQILSAQVGNDGERRALAIAAMSDELRQAIKARASNGAGEISSAAARDKDLIDDAMQILDYFEDLAVGIEEGVFDAVTARKLLQSALLQFWELLEALVGQYRVRDNRPTLYVAMENLSRKWSSES